MNIGEKIKAERIKKGYTQSELAGEQMTRSMLSVIESGRSLPSLENLSYLAKKLNIPMAYFVSEDTDPFWYLKRESVSRIRAAFEEERWNDCLYLIEKLDKQDDELHYLAEICSFEIGCDAVRRGSLVTADKHFQACKSHQKQTVLRSERVEALLPIYHAIVKNIQSPLLEFKEADYSTVLCDSLEYEFYRYFLNDTDYPYSDPLLAGHNNAKALIRQRKYSEAILLLSALEDKYKNDRYNAFVFLGIYTDLELCYRENVDFEKAYRYSLKRISLMEGFKS